MKPTLPIVEILIGLLFLVLIIAMVYRRKKRTVYVFGEQLARANELEQQRKEKGNAGPSPMPDGEYDFWRGEQSLINPINHPLDSTLSELCQDFARSDAETRANMRASISMDEFYTLLTFSSRASVFAIRGQNVQWVVDGLTAIAMIEEERTDFRDILVAISLLYYSANRIGEDADQLLRDAAALSEIKVSELLIVFIQRPPKEKDLRTSWGRDEVETEGGVGFIGWDFKEYNPTYDLKKTALETSDLISKDKYQPQFVSVASDLPEVWLESRDNRVLSEALKSIRAGAKVSARLRPNEHPDHDSQMFTVFLVEVADASLAQALLDLSRRKRSSGDCLLGIAEDRLFCLAVARSFVEDVESFETPESLSRFSTGLGRILKHSVGNE